jgi:DNA-directed RNA polymerase subunit M/transcription elongation factor TFIIS
MEVCPICNNLFDYKKNCIKCGERMEILDRIENYEDSYAPYLNYEITDLNDGTASNICSHLMICPKCKNKEILNINMIQK